MGMIWMTQSHFSKFSRYLLLCISFTFFLSCKAQESDIKRSKKTETIAGKKYFIHNVQKGQTLYGIAKAYSMEVNELVVQNPDAIDGIKPGQELKIPVDRPKVEVKAPSGDTIYHKVETGQTLYSLSKQYSLSIDAIIAANPGTASGVKVGQIIKIPKPGTKSTIAGSGNKIPQSSDSIPLLDSASAFKSIYNIALFLPFHAEQTDNIDVDKIVNGDLEFPQKSALAIEFYNGIKAAADSFSARGLSLKLFLYDVDESDSVKMSRVLLKPELASMHLIIGPLYTNNFQNIAAFAKNKRIPIISPVSMQNKILFNNFFVSKVTPSITTQMEQMASYISSAYSKENIILVNSPSVRDSAFVNTFKIRANEGLARQPFYKDSIKITGSGDGISSVLSRDRNNIVVIPSTGQITVTNILTQLNSLKDRYKITVFGMQSWNNFENLDPEYLNSLNVHLPMASYIDYENDSIQTFISNYRKSYLTDPGNLSFQGYDIGNYYFKGLLEHGLNFSPLLMSSPYKGLQISFIYKRITPDSGLENQAVYIVKYQDFKLVKANQ
jgi:LysM repeat protein/ABC-type branched-subunit amino acid transport system substrate-binding protein